MTWHQMFPDVFVCGGLHEVWQGFEQNDAQEGYKFHKTLFLGFMFFQVLTV